MGAVTYLAGLIEVPQEHGGVTALEERSDDVFVGTDQGYVMHLRVECEFPDHTHDKKGTSSRNDLTVESLETGPQVFTTSLGGVQVSSEHESVAQLHCSHWFPLVLVLCDNRLSIFEIQSWKLVGSVGGSVASFCVSDGVGLARLEVLRQKMEASPSQSKPFDTSKMLPSDVIAVTYAEVGQNEVRTAFLCPTGTASHRELFVLMTETIPLPSPPVSMAGVENMAVTLQLKRGLKLLLLEEGELRLVPLSLPMAFRQPRDAPLLSVSRDGELIVCVEDTLFSCSLGDALRLPTAKHLPNDHLCSEMVEEEMNDPNRSSVPRAAPVPDDRGTMPLNWKRTRRIQQDVKCVATHYPYLLQFGPESCVITSTLPAEKETESWGHSSTPYHTDHSTCPVETVRIPDVRFVVRPWSGNSRVYAASSTCVWMMSFQSLSNQWEDLIVQNRMGIALQWCYREWNRKLLCSEQLKEMEDRLRLRAGFYLLYSGRVDDAMFYFQHSSLDIRDLLLLLPECMPPLAHRGLLATGALPEGVQVHDSADTADGVTPYWEGWRGPCQWNFSYRRIVEKWKDLHQWLERKHHAKPTMDQEHQLDFPCLGIFIEECWRSLKRATERFIKEQCTHGWTKAHARAGAYASLVLALERHDYISAHSCCCSSHLCISDAEELLWSLKEFRLLACALWHNGQTGKAWEWIHSRLHISSLPSFSGLATKEVDRREPIRVARGEGWLRLPQELRQSAALVLFGISEVLASGNCCLPFPPDSSEGRTLQIMRWLAQQQLETRRLLAARHPDVPRTLSVEFVLLDHMDLKGLCCLLVKEPHRVHVMDEEGSSLLSVALSFLAARTGTPAHDNALHEAVIGAAALLVDAGCLTHTVNIYGYSCLDIIAISDPLHADAFTTALLSMKMSVRAFGGDKN